MKSHDAIQTRPLSLIGFAPLRLGPHNDLRDFCDLSCAEQDSNVVAFLEQAFSAKNKKVRVAAAKKAIEATAGKCGIAWAIMAREGAANIQEAITFSDQALAHLRLQLKRESSETELELKSESESKLQSQQVEKSKTADDRCKRSACMVDENLYAIVFADAAQLKWNEGRKDAATEMVLKQASESKISESASLFTMLSGLAASFLIQNGKIDDARQFLYQNNDDGAEWNYLNALVHFATESDTAISRTALAHAIDKGAVIATRLACGKTDSNDEELAEWNLCRYIENTEAAWLSVAGATGWLKKHYSNPLKMPGRESNTIAALYQDKKRWERWEALRKTADEACELNETLDAIEGYRAALKEAQRIEYTDAAFYQAAIDLHVILRNCSRPSVELQVYLEERAAILAKQDENISPLKGLQYATVANLYRDIDFPFKAARYYELALRYLTTAATADEAPTTWHEAIQAALASAPVLIGIQRFKECIEICKTALNLQERFLGPTHYEELETLSYLYECHSNLKEFKKGEAILERVRMIDRMEAEVLEIMAGIRTELSCGNGVLSEHARSSKFAYTDK